MPLFITAICAVVFSVWLTRRPGFRNRNAASAVVSQVSGAVTSQHLHLFQGGMLSETTVASVREEFCEKLDRGDTAAIEATMQPGLEFVVRVRALSEIGSEEAARLLERQLQRDHTRDPLEQSWYRIDVAHALRQMNHPGSLSALLEQLPTLSRSPLNGLYAAELVCFPGFGDLLEHPESRAGRLALRAVTQTLKAVRSGIISPQLYHDARLGDLIAKTVLLSSEQTDPFVAGVFLEILRHCRRISALRQATASNSNDAGDRGYETGSQFEALEEAEPIVREYLHGIADDLMDLWASASPETRGETLHVFDDLRIAPARLLREPAIVASNDPNTVGLLRWSAERESASTLHRLAHAETIARLMPGFLNRSSTDRRVAALLALRGHPSHRTEAILCRAAGDGDPLVRIAAIRSLGWWQPLDRTEVLDCLRTALADDDARLRHSSRFALARLGNISSLNVLHHMLDREPADRLHLLLEELAEEGIVQLWPEVAEMMSRTDDGIASHARETLARMSEEMFGILH